jgi:flagellar capping protein FliD
MPEVEEFRTKIEAIKKRLSGSDAEGSEEILELKERFAAVRDSLQRKQETIESQNTEISALREENAELSDMLDQAVTALEAKGDGGIKEIVKSIDSEFASLLADSEAEQGTGTVADTGGDRRGASNSESQPQEAQPQEAQPQEAQPQEAQSEDTKWEPENESVPVLQRIMGRRKR